MANGIHARFNLIGKRARPGTVPGVPLKRLMSNISINFYLFSGTFNFTVESSLLIFS
jgi:hypothetical protein